MAPMVSTVSMAQQVTSCLNASQGTTCATAAAVECLHALCLTIASDTHKRFACMETNMQIGAAQDPVVSQV